MEPFNLQEQYKSFLFSTGGMGYDNELYWDMGERPYPEYELTEGMYKSFSPEDMKRKIVKYLSLNPNQVIVYKDALEIFTPDLLENFYSLKNLMKVGGYFFTRESETKFPGYKLYRFEAWYQDIYNIKLEERFLLHVSPVRYLDKIQRNGLVPHGNDTNDLLNLDGDGKPVITEVNKLFKYPHRIFFFRGSTPKDKVERYTKTILGGEVEYALFQLTLSRVPESIQFYIDPSLKEYGIYTKDNIRPEWLDYKGKFKI